MVEEIEESDSNSFVLLFTLYNGQHSLPQLIKFELKDLEDGQRWEMTDKSKMEKIEQQWAAKPHNAWVVKTPKGRKIICVLSKRIVTYNYETLEEEHDFHITELNESAVGFTAADKAWMPSKYSEPSSFSFWVAIQFNTKSYNNFKSD